MRCEEKNGEAHKNLIAPNCLEKCKNGLYKPSKDLSKSCCGECLNACEIDGEIININETRVSKDDKCMKNLCTMDGEKVSHFLLNYQ